MMRDWLLLLPLLCLEPHRFHHTSTTQSAASPKASSPSNLPAGVLAAGSHMHDELEWLKPEKIRDAKKRRPSHPEYNPRTVYVPPDFFKSQTPAHKQWWTCKASNMDTVLFFKVGEAWLW